MTSRMEVFTVEYLAESEDGDDPEMDRAFYVAVEGSDPDHLFMNPDASLCEAPTLEKAQRIADLWNKFGGN